MRKRFTGFIEAETDRLISAIQTAGSAELRREFAGPLAVAVVTNALGLRDVNADTVLSWYAAIVAAVSEVTAGQPVTAAGADAFGQLRAAVARAIGHTDEPSVLTEAARAREGLSQDEVVSNAAVLMFGGIDTTEGMIVNAVRHLLGDPEALALVRGGADLLPNAIEESIRLEPAAAVVDRYATRDVELGGARIRRGDLVTVSIAGANRDPAVFTDPNRFNIRRANARLNLAFAQGPHFCLGHSLPGPRPRSRSVDSWTACPGCGSIPTTRTRHEASCSANRRPCTCAGQSSPGRRSKAVAVFGFRRVLNWNP